MSLLDDTFNSFRDITGSVIEKTGKFVDASRLKLTASEISKEITRRYESLGRVVYDARKAGTDINGLVDECVTSIDALYSRLDDVNARVAKLRDKHYCATCGAVIDRDSVYCARCGCRVRPNTEQPAAEQPESEQKSDAEEKAEAPFTEADMEQAADKVAEAVDEVVEKVNDAAQEVMDDIADAVESITEE